VLVVREFAVSLVVNKSELAKILGVSKPTMGAILDRYPDFPIEQRGGLGVEWKFNPDLAKAFIIAKRAEEEAANATRSELLAQCSLPLDDVTPEEPGAPRALSAVERLQHARAMLAEDKLARERQFMVLKTDMRPHLGAVWLSLSQSLQALPAQIAARYNLPLPVVRDLKDFIATFQRDTYARLIDLLPEGTPPPEEDEGEDEAA
jgi:phage terminase Nu1 subunit (DNA packaging protein)